MLTTEQIKEFKKTLETKKKTLEQELEKVAIKNENGKWVAKFEDIDRNQEANALEVEEFTNKEAVINTLNEDLKKVVAALERIKTNTYGKCITCGHDITIERLSIFPEAQQCRHCAKKNF